MRWVRLNLYTTRPYVEQIETLLNLFGACSLELSDAKDQPILEPDIGETPLWDDVVVSGLFIDDEQLMLDAVLKHINTHCEISHTSQEMIEDTAWERSWMQHYQPISCGKRIWIVPQWLPPVDPTAINIKLDPGLAFGTGEHASTHLCLNWLDEQYDLADETVLDYGCGSGILGIAALKLGALRAFAVDIDPQALTATQYNAELNGVEQALWMGLPDAFEQMSKRPEINLIIANILAGPLIQLAPFFSTIAKRGTRIVLAGILSDQADDVMQAYSAFCMQQVAIREHNWVLLAGQKSN